VDVRVVGSIHVVVVVLVKYRLEYWVVVVVVGTYKRN
jgi:hypothetical protein